MSGDWRNYVSVMTPTATSGDLTFHLETFDSDPNISLTMMVSALEGEDEITVAERVKSQCSTILRQASAYYNGIPVFSNQVPAATFDLQRTDSCVSFWSQATFRLRLTGNTTGCSLKIASTPTPITLAQAKSIAILNGVAFEDGNENTLTDNQIMDLVEIASNQIIEILNNPFVIACYLHEYLGNMEDTFFLRYGPIVNWDQPYIRRPFYLLYDALSLLQTKVNFSVDSRLRMVNYRYQNDLFSSWSPGEMNNEFKMTYRAGFMNFPRLLLDKIVQASSLALNNTNVKSLKGGSFAVEFRLPIETLQAIALEMRQYKNN